jgi:hypothetical protein
MSFENGLKLQRKRNAPMPRTEGVRATQPSARITSRLECSGDDRSGSTTQPQASANAASPTRPQIRKAQVSRWCSERRPPTRPVRIEAAKRLPHWIA